LLLRVPKVTINVMRYYGSDTSTANLADTRTRARADKRLDHSVRQQSILVQN